MILSSMPIALGLGSRPRANVICSARERRRGNRSRRYLNGRDASVLKCCRSLPAVTKHDDSTDKFGKNLSDEDKQKVYRLEKEMGDRTDQIKELEEYLPRKNGLYLRIILGNVNVSLLDQADKFKYKDEFEKFKLIVTAIGVVVSFLNLTVLNSRYMDLAFLFLLVWYYCTLTIRESILKVNGSRIKGWWRAHHFLSTVISGILLIWPDTPTYYKFRKQFMLFNCYIGLVQYLQFRYQRGCLYRLKSLGERHNMDITIEGFHSWMWRGLSFLLPFLYLGYGYQLYNAYVLYYYSLQEDCTEWQVPFLSVGFFTLFLGNVITTSMVIPQKLKEKLTLRDRFNRFINRNGANRFRHFNNVKDVAEEKSPDLSEHEDIPSPAEKEIGKGDSPASSFTKKEE